MINRQRAKSAFFLQNIHWSIKRTIRDVNYERKINFFSLPTLPYEYDALSPVISKEILQIHHQKHHQAYVNNLNRALEMLSISQCNNDVPGQIESFDLIKFNSGGHINHSMYWENLKAFNKEDEENLPEDKEIKLMINKEWGSFDTMKLEFIGKSSEIQGSGYGWLGYNKERNRIEFSTTGNQDILQTKGLLPLLSVDVWEHAYYLQYQNNRLDYLTNIWKIINWKCVSERLLMARGWGKILFRL